MLKFSSQWEDESPPFFNIYIINNKRKAWKPKDFSIFFLYTNKLLMSNDKREVGGKVRVLTLSDCDYCSWLKSELNIEGIPYVNIDADMFNDFSVSVEKKFQTEYYPIVFIDIGDKVITILSETKLETSETLRTFNTIPELIGIIKSYIK